MLVAEHRTDGARRLAADGRRARRGPAARRHPHRRPPPRPAHQPAHRPLQERPLHDHQAAAARRARRRRRPRAGARGSSPGATSSATRSRCATTCSASGATPPAPASPRATTCARASRPPCSPGRPSCCPTGPAPLLAACDAGTLDDAGVDALQRAMVDAGVRDRAEQRRRATWSTAPTAPSTTSTSTPRPRPPCATSPMPSPGGPREGRRHRGRPLRPGRRMPPHRRRATTSPSLERERPSGGRAGRLQPRGLPASTPARS